MLLCEAGPGHAARQGAARDPRQLSRHRLFRSALPLDRAQGPHPGRQPQQSAGEPPAAAQIRAGARAGRRLVDQRPAGQSRRADRLRRMGGARRRGLELERRAALLQEGRARHRFRRAAGTARTAASRCAASRPSTGPATPRRWPRPSSAPATSSCPTRTASSATAISRSRISNHDERRVSAAMGYLDAETRKRAEPDDLDRHAGQGAAVRGHALRRRQGAGRRPRDRSSAAARSSCPPARSIRRRICCAPASARSGI